LVSIGVAPFFQPPTFRSRVRSVLSVGRTHSANAIHRAELVAGITPIGNVTPFDRGRSAAWNAVKDFAGYGDATYLWPRWLVLRAVGLLYVIAFAGVCREANAIIGPRGLTPLAGFFAETHQNYPHVLEALLRAPSLFWLNASPAMIGLLAWTGLLAAIALVFNFWPRVTLAICWVCFLSFVATWRGFTATQVDQLILETALLCIPFAPAGMRPGLGAASPPRPLTVLIVRWLLFRVMFESGIVKLIGGDPHWLRLTALDVLYETSPFPTFLGFIDHQMPHAYHVAEALLTYAAEVAAPLLAVFGGRRGRWWAFGCWTIFQAGIQLTNNFGWLNTASIGLGLLLLDDQMIAAALRRWRIAVPSIPNSTAAATIAPARWTSYALSAAFAIHTATSLHAFALQWGMPEEGFPFAMGRPLKTVFADFHSANGYTLYGGLLPARIGVEFEGSNDGGTTWRPYEFRYQPQRETQISPFIAPRYPRFEATLQVEANRSEPSPLFGLVGAQLLRRSPEVMALFRTDPFADRPATLLRVPVYHLTFTDFATWRKTGRYWKKEFVGFYRPTLILDAQGRVSDAATPLDEIRARAESGSAAAQDLLGTAYAAGDGVAADPATALLWWQKSADQNNAEGQFHLGLAYARGVGTNRDAAAAARAFRLAAEQAHPLGQYYLGLAYARGEGVARDIAAAARWFQLAAAQGVTAAQGRLGSMYSHGEGVAANPAEAAKWLRLAAEGGNAYAQLNVALLYARGEGVPRDEVEALAWLTLAAESGDAEAVANKKIAEQRVGAAGIAAASRRAEQLRAVIAARAKN
jgi:TPR repeat protein